MGLRLKIHNAWTYIEGVNNIPNIISNVLTYLWVDEKTGAKVSKSLLDKEKSRFPTGVYPLVIRELKAKQYPYEIEDITDYPTLNKPIPTAIHLRDYQTDATDRFLLGVNEYEIRGRGCISAGTGAGKTVMAMWITAQLAQQTLFCVHTKDLLIQTVREFSKIFGANMVGVAGGGADNFRQPNGELRPIIVCMIQAFAYHGKKKAFEVKPHYKEILDKTKVLILDECLVEGTRVLDQNGMPILIESVKDGAKLVGGEVSHSFNRSVKEVLEIVHQSNTLTTTFTHTNMVIRRNKIGKLQKGGFYRFRKASDKDVEEVKSIDLNVGDFLLVPTKVPHTPEKLSGFTYNQLRFIAQIMCDGHILTDTMAFRVETSTDPEWHKEVFMQGLKDFGVDEFQIYVNSRGNHIFYCSDKNLYRFLTYTLKIPAGKKSDVISIHPDVWNSSLEDLKGFIDGCLSCEGDIVGNRVTVVNTTSEKFADDVQLLLLKYGIYSTKRLKARDDESHKKLYMISICGEDIRNFKKIFNVTLSRKNELIQNVPEFNTHASKVVYDGVEYRLSEIKKIESKEGDFTVYDFTTTSHLFVANNTLTHNCHHAASDTWFWVAQSCPAPFRLGLSATPYRKDGRQLLLFGATGPIIHRISCKELVERGWLSKPDIKMYTVDTRLDSGWDENGATWPMKYKAGIVFNAHRNAIIVAAMRKAFSEGKSVLTIVNQKAHGWNIQLMLEALAQNDREKALFVSSDFDLASRKTAMELFRSGQRLGLIGTSAHEKEPVWIRNKHTGEIRIVRIGDFVNSFKLDKLFESPIDGILNEVNSDDVTNYEALTETKDGTVVWRTIKAAIRHKNKGNVIQLKYANGMRSWLTTDHSLVDNNYQEITPEVGNTAKVLNHKIYGDQEEINVVETILQSDLNEDEMKGIEVTLLGIDRHKIYDLQKVRSGNYNGPLDLGLMWEKDIIKSHEDLKSFEEEYNRIVRYEKWKYRCNLKDFHESKYVKYLPAILTCRRSRSEVTLPTKLKITPELALVLGAFAAEGTLCYSDPSQYIVNWACQEDCKFDSREGFCDKTEIRDTLIENIEIALGHKPKEDKFGLHFRSKLMFAFFSGLKVLYNNHEKAAKQVPPVIWNCSLDAQRSFLWGYFLGDGSLEVVENYKRTKFTSTSYELLCGVKKILENLDSTRISLHKKSFTEKAKKDGYSLCVSDDPFYFNTNTEPNMSKLSSAGYIKETEKLEDQPEYVYDLSVEDTETFYTGCGALAHNTLYDEGIDLPSVNVVIMAAGGMAENRSIQRLGRSLRRGDRCLYIDLMKNCNLLSTPGNPVRCMELDKDVTRYDPKLAAKFALNEINERLGNIQHWTSTEYDMKTKDRRYIDQINSKEVMLIYNTCFSEGLLTETTGVPAMDRIAPKIKQLYAEIHTALESNNVGAHPDMAWTQKYTTKSSKGPGLHPRPVKLTDEQKAYLKDVNEKARKLFRLCAWVLGVESSVTVRCPYKKVKTEVEFIDFYDLCDENLKKHSYERLTTYDDEEHDPQPGQIEDLINALNGPDKAVAQLLSETEGMVLEYEEMMKKYGPFLVKSEEDDKIEGPNGEKQVVKLEEIFS